MVKGDEQLSTIDGFVRSHVAARPPRRLSKDPQSRGSVFNTGARSNGPRETTLEEINNVWIDGNRPLYPLNWLDWHNSTGVNFVPRFIADSALDGEDLSSWFILSMRDSVSPWHVDNGGQLAWLHVLEGRKVVYFRRATFRDIENGTVGFGNPQCRLDSIAISLDAGDLVYVVMRNVRTRRITNLFTQHHRSGTTSRSLVRRGHVTRRRAFLFGSNITSILKRGGFPAAHQKFRCIL